MTMKNENQNGRLTDTTALRYVNEKTKTYVEPLAKELEAKIFMPFDVATPGMLEAVFESITKEWGEQDIVVHSIAWAPKADCILFILLVL